MLIDLLAAMEAAVAEVERSSDKRVQILHHNDADGLSWELYRDTLIEQAEQKIGVVSHYFGKIEVAAIELTEGELRVGDTIHVKGHTSDFTQTVDSMQRTDPSSSSSYVP